MPASDVSIVVSTYERAAFVQGLFEWYRRSDFRGELVIADASSSSHQLRSSIARSRWPFEWKVVSVPKTPELTTANSMNEAFRAGLSVADRQWSILSCDDDLLLVDTI